MADIDTPFEFGPLTGITVLDLTTASPGLYTSMLLGDMGADVIKISAPPKGGDGATRYKAVPPGHLDRNKASMRLNLKSAEGQDVFLQLAKRADVVIEGFRPGVTKRLGIDFESLHEHNPRLIYAAMSGYGQDGPAAMRPGHDINYLAESGILSLLGPPSSAPSVPLNLVADLGGAALHTVAGILLALFARERGGEGQLVDVAYADTSIALMSATPTARARFEGATTAKRGQDALSGAYAYYGLYTTSDGELLSVGCLEPWFWAHFCDAIERPDLGQFAFVPDHYSRVPTDEETRARADVQQVLAEHTAEEWIAHFAAFDLPVSAVRSLEDVQRDPQTQHRGMFTGTADQSVEHRIGVPIKLSATPGTIRSAPPTPGSDANVILQRFDYSDEEIQLLAKKAGI